MNVTFLLCVFFMIIAVIALYYGQIETFVAFFAFFGICAAVRMIPRTDPRKKQDGTGNPSEEFVVESEQRRRRRSMLYGLGLSFARLPVISALFQHELKTMEKKIPYTGRIIDARHFVINGATVTLLCLISMTVAMPVVSAISGISYYLYLLIPSPLLIPILSPVLLSLFTNDRKTGSDSEFLAFVTYVGIMHTVQKTMFWTMQSMCDSKIFSHLRNDSRIVLRYAKGGGEEEGHSITLMARYHPNRKLREFLEKYVSYIPTNPTRLANHVENTREESLNSITDTIRSYTDSANMVFFMGTMMVSILPIVLTVMAFLPSSGFDGTSLIGIMFVLPLVFVIFPVFLSTGTMFLQGQRNISKISALAGAASFAILYVTFPESLLVSVCVSVVTFSGINWALTARRDSDGANADSELPDMLDYIAEQKKSKNNMVQIFSEYAALSNTARPIRNILDGIASDILVKPSREAFLERAFPSKTVQFVFFMLHAIYEHGGGTYETVISMAHSIRRVTEMKNQFVSSSRFSAIIVVASPVVFMFSVMMTSFVTFGAPDDVAGRNIPANAMMIMSSDVTDTVKSLQPVSLIIAIAGGLGISRVVRYSFLHTQYLFFTTALSLACLLLWDTLFDILQSLT